MATASRLRRPSDAVPDNVAELLHRLGDIPPERVRLQPPPGTATQQDVIAALEAPRKRICELVDGVLVEKPMGAREALYAVVIIRHLEAFVDEHDLGIVLAPDGTLRIMPGLVRIPDVSFIPWERIPGGEMPLEAIPGLVPALALEVMSVSNTAREMQLKIEQYFAAGVLVVWLVYPKTQTAEIYTSPTQRRKVGKAGSLDGGELLPGFRLPLATIFARPRRRRRK